MGQAGKVFSVNDSRELWAVEHTVPQLKELAATASFQAIVTLCGNVGCMVVNRMGDKKMAKDTEDSKDCGKLADNTYSRSY